MNDCIREALVLYVIYLGPFHRFMILFVTHFSVNNRLIKSGSISTVRSDVEFGLYSMSSVIEFGLSSLTSKLKLSQCKNAFLLIF